MRRTMLPNPSVWLAVGVTFAALVAVGAALASDQRGDRLDVSPDARSSQIVDEIVAGNIFSAERRRVARESEPTAPPAPEPEPEPTPPPNPDASLVLVGVVVRDEVSYAFIEDRRSGEIRRVRAPGDFAQGEITRIDIDGVDYRVDGATQTIGVLQTFAGDDVDGLAQRAPGASSDSASRSPDRQAILERLRQRRAQQTSSGPAPSSNRE